MLSWPRPADAVTMDEARFQSLARRAKVLTGDYGAGYQTRRRRHHHDKEFCDQREHELPEVRQDEYCRGYRDGLTGQEPTPLVGRPLLPAGASCRDKRPRTVRLDDEHWEKLRRLGTDWLERAMDRAREPDDSTRKSG